MTLVKNLLGNWLEGLSRTRQTAFKQIKTIFTGSEITPETWEMLEALLIQADVGIATTQSIISGLTQTINTNGISTLQEYQTALRTELLKHLMPSPEVNFQGYNPVVIMIVGVNGSGKTTTLAKLANYYKNSGKQVILAAADTYRAAADEQLSIWAKRIDVPLVDGEPGSDPGAVVYNTIQSAIARKKDLVIIDTAGRLHTRHNLMEELKKVQRVAGKAQEGAPHACWLVIDAITGQNALTQAQYFKDAVRVDGVILAKLDLSARGGMAFAIQDQLRLPIIFAGLGEGIDDLQVFSPEAFVDGIIRYQEVMEK